MKPKKYLKLITLLILGILLVVNSTDSCYASNFEYDYKINTVDDFDELTDNNVIVKLKSTGRTFEEGLNYIYSGSGIDEDGQITIDVSTPKTFSVSNDINYWSVLNFVDSEGYFSMGNAFPFGGDYYEDTMIVSEEIEFRDLILGDNNNASGEYTFRGEYISYETDERITVYSEGIIDNYAATHMVGTNIVGITFGMSDIDNIAEVNIGGRNEIRGVVGTNDWTGTEDAGKIGFILDIIIDDATFTDDYSSYIAENDIFIEQEINEQDILDQEINEPDPVIETTESTTNEIENAFIPTSESTNVDPAYVMPVALASITLATTISTIFGTSGGFLSSGITVESDLKILFEESGMDSNSKIDEETLNEAIKNAEYQISVNHGVEIPNLINRKESVFNLNVKVEDTENSNWTFGLVAVSPECPGLVRRFSTMTNANNESMVPIIIKGSTFEGIETKVYCNVLAVAKKDNKTKIAHGSFEFTVLNPGLNVKVIDENKEITKDNISVTFVKDSTLKGMADITELNSEEYTMELTEDGKQGFISAINVDFGSCKIDIS